jgi:uncharacterized damage-inducible protein DinB
MGNEINRITKQFTNLQHGDCWLGINFKEALHGIDAAKAVLKLKEDGNSIWTLVSHIIYWRSIVINRLTGSNNPPPFPDFLLPDELTEETWKQTLHDFEAVYHLLRSTIHNFKEENLDKPSPKPGQTFYELIEGCLQHDAYHLGQIMIIKKSRI